VKTTDYGFIGVGRMGAHMARRLLKAGISLTVYDTSKDACDELAKDGAQVASSALDVANNTEIAFLSLPTPDIVQKVCSGLTGAKKMKVVVDCSTTGPGVARIAHAELAKAGIIYMDAPVSGGMAGARDGTLAVMVSGKRAVYDRVEPAIKQFGKLFFCGEGAGLAQVMKLANNIIAAGVIVMSAEVIAMGTKAGLNPRQMCDIINAGSGRNSATQDKFPLAILNRKFNLGFKTGLMYKDVALCMSEADRLGATMWVGNNTKEIWKLAQETLGADSDFTEIVRLFENWSNVIVSAQDAEADL
jgi:3-hydroxyisobutyrate dehydrogenase-like beta-hydroxyacid dehydrogenase